MNHYFICHLSVFLNNLQWSLIKYSQIGNFRFRWWWWIILENTFMSLHFLFPLLSSTLNSFTCERSLSKWWIIWTISMAHFNKLNTYFGLFWNVSFFQVLHLKPLGNLSHHISLRHATANIVVSFFLYLFYGHMVYKYLWYGLSFFVNCGFKLPLTEGFQYLNRILKCVWVYEKHMCDEPPYTQNVNGKPSDHNNYTLDIFWLPI